MESWFKSPNQTVMWPSVCVHCPYLSKERSLNVEHPQSLPVVHIYNRDGPKFPLDAPFTPPLENTEQWSTAMLEYHVWILTRTIGSHGHQQVPAFGGFISATGTAPMKKKQHWLLPTNQWAYHWKQYRGWTSQALRRNNSWSWSEICYINLWSWRLHEDIAINMEVAWAV